MLEGERAEHPRGGVAPCLVLETPVDPLHDPVEGPVDQRVTGFEQRPRRAAAQLHGHLLQAQGRHLLAPPVDEHERALVLAHPDQLDALRARRAHAELQPVPDPQPPGPGDPFGELGGQRAGGFARPAPGAQHRLLPLAHPHHLLHPRAVAGALLFHDRVERPGRVGEDPHVPVEAAGDALEKRVDAGPHRPLPVRGVALGVQLADAVDQPPRGVRGVLQKALVEQRQLVQRRGQTPHPALGGPVEQHVFQHGPQKPRDQVEGGLLVRREPQAR